MTKHLTPVFLTLTNGEGQDWITRLWLYNYDAATRTGDWYLEDTDFLHLVARERNGRFRLVARPGASHRLDFWDCDENRPAFVLFNAPVSSSEPVACRTSIGLIMNPRDPAGLAHDLEWDYAPDLNLSL